MMANLVKCLREERGQALLMVLALLVIGSLTLPAVLSLIGTSLKSGEVYDRKTDELYTADSGVEDAIWQIKYDMLDDLLETQGYDAYDYTTNWSYEIDDPMNDLTATVTVQNVWIPSNTTLSELGLTPSEARDIIERSITDNETNALIVTGTNTETEGEYRVKIDFYPAVGSEEALAVDSVGVWLPYGFTYVNDSSTLDTYPGTTGQFSEEVTVHAGGQAVVWTFTSELPFTDMPPGPDPGDRPQSAQIFFQYSANVTGARPATVSWITTAGDVGDDIPISWDVDTTIYKITSVAGGTEIEAYPSRCELRKLGDAIAGDYLAIGNTLMVDNGGDANIRDLVLDESTTDTKDPYGDYRIPSDASVIDAYLYWSGWFKVDSSDPQKTQPIWEDKFYNLNNWSQTDNVWYESYDRLYGHYPSADPGDEARKLTMNITPIDLHSYPEGSVVVAWEQSEDDNLEPGDALKFRLSGNNGADWTGWITAFEDDINTTMHYHYVVPDACMTNGFLLQFYLEGFAEDNERCRIDNLHVAQVVDDTVLFEIENSNPLAPDYSGEITAGTLSILDNASHGEYSYACYQNVTGLVKAYSENGTLEDPFGNGNGTYTVGGADADTKEHWSYCGWSLIIIYASPETAGHQLYLYDTFSFSSGYQDLDFDNDDEPGGDITGFVVPEKIEGETVAATLTCFVGEGDRAWYPDFLAINAPEEYRAQPQNIPNDYKLWDGIDTTSNSESYPNNVWNSRSRHTGGAVFDGVDVDTFTVTWDSGLILADDTEAHIDLYSGQDNWNLIYMILSVRSKTVVGGTVHYLINGG